MSAELHRDISIRTMRFGHEQAPLMVIDSFVTDPDVLVSAARGLPFRLTPRSFPGIRALAPTDYRQLLTDMNGIGRRLVEFFELDAGALRLSMCHFSIVMTHPSELLPIQRVPHVDSVRYDGLATIHYLFHANLGGTAFYRHRATGFEFVDETREEKYVAALQAEFQGSDSPGPAYINGDTPLFERIKAQDGVFNRMLVYRRNSLHAGSIAPNFVPDPNPATGRLSINSFIDIVK